MTKYIFVTGGVVSGLGKGITAASLGRLLKARGLKVAAQKLDPYINVDPGTMSPLALRSLPSEAAVIPFPSPDTTPPVTNIYFVIAIHLFTFHSYLLLYLTPTPPLPEALR